MPRKQQSETWTRGSVVVRIVTSRRGRVVMSRGAGDDMAVASKRQARAALDRAGFVRQRTSSERAAS